MFKGCEKLKSLPDISKWNTDSLIHGYGLFRECKSLVSIPDISK